MKDSQFVVSQSGVNSDRRDEQGLWALGDPAGHSIQRGRPWEPCVRTDLGSAKLDSQSWTVDGATERAIVIDIPEWELWARVWPWRDKTRRMVWGVGVVQVGV